MADPDITPRSTQKLVVEAQAAIEREKRRNVFAVALAALTVVFAAGFVAVSVFLIVNVEHQLRRQDCIAHIQSQFSGHLAEALSQEPASLSRDAFLGEMKADAAKLARLDQVCPV